MAKVLALVGGVLLAVGLVVGFVPVSASGVSCGSAFVASEEANVADLTGAMMGRGMGTAADDCSSSRSTWRIIALGLAIPGGLLLGLAGMQAVDWGSERRTVPW